LLNKFKLFVLVAVALSGLLLSSGCRSQPSSGQGTQTEITVAAAANLSDAFAALAQQFQTDTGNKVVYNFASTAELSQQAENGAPFDVIAAADVEHIDQLEVKGLLLPGTKAVYARGRLALWTPPGSNARLNRVEDVISPSVDRIAIAKPDLAPYGRAAVESLRALNIWQIVEPKVVYGQSVSQAKQYAASGNAQVAFIPVSLIRPHEGSYITIDEKLHAPINQAIAVLKSSQKQDAARRFVDYVMGEKGQELLRRYGYDRP
jgi:molybdate transport system substrate-binding protein